MHQPEGNRQGKHGAVPHPGGKHRVDHHVDLGGAAGDDRRPHQTQDRLYPGIAPLDVGVIDVSLAVEAGNLDEQLQRAAHQRADGEPHDSPGAEVGIEPPPQTDADHDRAKVEEARCHRRHAEHVARIQHSHRECRERHQQDEGIHHAGQRDGELSLLSRETRRQQSDQLGGEYDSQEGERAEENDRQRPGLVRQAPGCIGPLSRDRLAEDGGEHRRERALREQIAQQVGNAECDGEGIHHPAAAEQRGADLLAHQPQHAAAQHRQPDQAGGFRVQLLRSGRSFAVTHGNVVRCTDSGRQYSWSFEIYTITR